MAYEEVIIAITALILLFVIFYKMFRPQAEENLPEDMNKEAAQELIDDERRIRRDKYSRNPRGIKLRKHDHGIT